MNDEDKVQATLTTEELRGIGESNSRRELTAHEDYEAAKEALDKVNVQALFQLYEKAVRQHNKMEKVFIDVCEWNLRTKDGGKLPLPPGQESETIIGSMERVALAAIDLAKIVALEQNDKK